MGKRGQKAENKAKQAEKNPPPFPEEDLKTYIALLHGLFNRNGDGDSRADHRVVARNDPYVLDYNFAEISC